MTTQLGIIGAGQLGLMLAEAGVRMGIQPLLLAKVPEEPAARICTRTVFAPKGLTFEILAQFFQQVSTVIFENEFLDCGLLKRASIGTQAKFFPTLQALSLFQDKLEQKLLLGRLGIPTAEFAEIKTKADLAEALGQFGGVCVLKWARMGYDGKGVLKVTQSELDSEKVAEFLRQSVGRDSRVYAEKLIAFKRELAVLGCHSVTGEFKAYPLVISEQVDGVCSLVYGPATELGVARALQKTAQEWAHTLATQCLLHGVFALELFETVSGELLVNEIAPRVHNSGHYTQDAGITDQFENHIRAVIGMPLGTTEASGVFAMLNILGPAHVVSSAVPPIPTERLHLHWYGKEIRPGRKLGHLNGRLTKGDYLPDLIQEMKRCVAAWEKA